MLWKPTYSRMFFSPEGDGGGGGGSQQGAQSGANQGQQQGQSQNGDASGQQGGDGQGGDQSKQSKMLSQDEVNKLIEDRLTRAKSKWDKDAEDARQKAAQKDLPEVDRLKAENDRLTKLNADHAAKVRDADSRESVRATAKKLGAVEDSINAIYRMVKSDIEFDDDGKPTNVDGLLAEAKQIAPQLFKPAVGKGDGGAGKTTTAKKGDFMRAAYDSRGGG